MKITFRLATVADAKDILEIYTPFIEKTAKSFEVEVPSLKEYEDRVSHIGEKYPWVLCFLEGELAGYAYASLHMSRAAYQWDAQASVYLKEEFHRHKIATALYFCLFEILKAQGFFNVLSLIHI